MPKNIIFCADGTWNGSSQGSDKSSHFTNVYKLFGNLRNDEGRAEPCKSENGATGADDALEMERVVTKEEKVLQIAKYLHGVGDSSNPLVKLLGGTIGVGLVGRVIRGYTFISRNYQADDRIHLVGFSRGAYTARALAGLISAKGLLSTTANDLNDREAAYKLGLAVWAAYRQEPAQTSMSGFGRFQALLMNVPHLFDQQVEDFQLVPKVEIQTVAVWDTVGSIGIPGIGSDGHPTEALQFVDNQLSEAVAKGFHAVSLDERRPSFPSCGWAKDDRVDEVLFPGAHADVGGGYHLGESGLSDGALKWMTEQLTDQKVLFSEPPAWVASPNATGVAHQPWEEPLWREAGSKVRSGLSNQFDSGFRVHASVQERMVATELFGADKQISALYRPENLTNYLDADGVSIRPDLIAR